MVQGKSTFAPSFLPESVISFDYDKFFLEYYNQLPDSELREEFAKNKITELFEKAVDKALTNKADFCYETNFDVNPLVLGRGIQKRRLHDQSYFLLPRKSGNCQTQDTSTN